MTKRQLTPAEGEAYLQAQRQATPGRTCQPAAWTGLGKRSVVVVHLQAPRIAHAWPYCGTAGAYTASSAAVVTCQRCLAREAQSLWRNGRAWEVRAVYAELARILAHLGT